MRIAVAGKGGSGKTTFSSLLIYHLKKLGKTPILAVDADPNTNLNEALGMRPGATIADVRDELVDKKVPHGMTKHDFVSLKLEEALVENKGVDLLVMGHPEGRGCYCFVNEVLRQHLHKIDKRYPYIVMDNEAGMEHLSRRTTDDVDWLFLISEPTLLGLRSAARIKEAAKLLKLKIGSICLVIMKAVGNELNGAQKKIVEEGSLKLAGFVPMDNTINEFRENEKSLLGLPDNSAAVEAVGEIMRKVEIYGKSN